MMLRRDGNIQDFDGRIIEKSLNLVVDFRDLIKFGDLAGVVGCS